MRSRTALTLWQAIVRPLLEYASELWSGQVPDYLVQSAEAVQMTFLRGTLGLHGNGSGVADEVIRAEAGCERLQDRWMKLKLGFWRHLFAAKPGRLLRVVAEHRHRELVDESGVGRGVTGWMCTARDDLEKCGLDQYWTSTAMAANEPPEDWRAVVYKAVDAVGDEARRARMDQLPSTTDYVSLKEWGVNTKVYSFSTGEIGRLGQHVPERYLDDRHSLKETRLKMLCRVGALPVMKRVGREMSPPWPVDDRVCFVCGGGVVESVHHFLMECPMYEAKRKILLDRIGTVYGNSFNYMSSKEKELILLGKRFYNPRAEDTVDRLVKRFIIKAWNLRQPVTDVINSTFNTNYEVFVAPSR